MQWMPTMHKRTRSTWTAMKQRCLNKNNPSFADYGGRGITVCQRWLDSFQNFLADMGERPAGMSIDRIDVNGNYEPGNCKWSTPKEQVANRRRKEESEQKNLPVTDRQHEIHAFIKSFLANHKYAPTIREIASSFGIQSPNGVKCHLDALREKGRVTWVDGDSRTLVAIDPEPKQEA
jgi:hypothetical protein